MKQYIVSKAGILFLFLLSVSNVSGQRIMSYNIQHGHGLDDQINLERTTEMIRSENLDIVAIQEIDSCCKRTDYVDQPNELARLTGMHMTFAPAIDFQGGRYGVGILSREKPLSVRRVPLPGKGEARVLLMIEMERYVMACTHLALREADRMASVPIIIEEAKSYDKPFLLAGDWNDSPESDFIQDMKHHFSLLSGTDILTFPSDTPKSCIDYIGLFQPSPKKLKLKERAVIHTQNSDHLPIEIEIE